MKSVLLFQYRDNCYASFLYFAECLAEEFRKMGYRVELCRFTMKTLDVLEQYAGQYFDMIIDFNSILAGAVMDSGERLLDKIEGPFYNYLLDHPLYHHEYLKIPLKSHRAICIDRDHVQYIRNYYPHIEQVMFLPLGGMYADEEREEAQYEISLSGTYTSPEKIITIINGLTTNIKNTIFQLIDIMKQDAEITCEQAMKKLLQDRNLVFSEQNFAEAMNFHFLADMYMRALNRHEVIEAIVSSGTDLHVLGHGYEDYMGKGGEHLILHKSVPFSKTLQFLKQSKISLNVMPGFKDGAHDRIFSAMLNYSVALTDESRYLKERFADKDLLLFYQITDLDQIPYRIQDSLADEAKLELIREKAFREAKAKDTWEMRCAEFLKNT